MSAAALPRPPMTMRLCGSTGASGAAAAAEEEEGACTGFRRVAVYQGLTLVHFSAQLEPCPSQENTLHTLNTP